MSGTGSAAAQAPDELDQLMAGWTKREQPRTDRARWLVERALAQSRQARQRSTGKPQLPPGNAPQVLRGLALGRVPPDYRAATWAQCPEANRLRSWCRDLPARLEAGGGLIMAGLTSRGKSFAAALVAQRAVQHGYSVRWAYLPELLELLRRDRRDSRRIEELDAQRDADLVVWDDFGAVTMTGWDVSLCDHLVEVRHGRRRSTVVTTNLTRETLDSDQTLARIMARWNDRNRWLYFTGPSLRSTSGGSGEPRPEGLPLEC